MKNDVEITEIADLKRQNADLKVQMAPEMHRNSSEKSPQSRDHPKLKLPESDKTEWSRDGRLPDSRGIVSDVGKMVILPAPVVMRLIPVKLQRKDSS